ncbi:MAG: beta-galactosidase trimerization domain-containing protein [Candidatus Brocadiia bacterium]|nr:beta-galactosidase trimerization domain-containing protein [Candidatus Brocadiia bacterium]
MLRRPLAHVGLFGLMAVAAAVACGCSGSSALTVGPDPSEEIWKLVGPSGGSYYDKDPERQELLFDAYWIWWDKDAPGMAPEYQKASFTFDRDYELTGPVRSAWLRMTAESQYTLQINGKDVGSSETWYELDTYDIASYLVEGTNHFRVRARSTAGDRRAGSFGGMFLAARVTMADGSQVELLSDRRWTCRNGVDDIVKQAEPVVRGINGGWWRNAGRVLVMPRQFYGLATELKVPGIEWGKGHAGDEPKVLAVLDRRQQRDLAELAQRMDMDLTVAYTTSWQEGRRYAFFPHAEGVRKADVRRRLKDVLQDDYDVVILGSVPGELFQEVMSERLEQMVRGGTGLVSPRLPAELRKQLTETSVKGEDAPAFLRVGTPFAALPAFRASADESEGYRHVAGLYRYGDGRVIELRLGGLLADARDTAELNYEYYMSFALRAVLWAAGEEPAVALAEMPAAVQATYGEPASVQFTIGGEGGYKVKAAVRSPELLSRKPQTPTTHPSVKEFAEVLAPLYETEIDARGGEEAALELPVLPAGQYYVDLMVERSRGALWWRRRERLNWAVAHLTVDGPARIAELTTDPAYIDVSDGKQAKLTARATLSEGAPAGATVRFQVIDNDERVVAEREAKADADFTAQATFPFDFFATTLGRVRAELLVAGQAADVAAARFTAVRRDWDRFFFVMYGGPGAPDRKSNIVHWRLFTGDGIDARRSTIPTLEDLEVADMLAVPSHGGYERGPIAMEPEELQRRRENASETAEKAIPFDPLTYTVDDEIIYGGGDLAPHRITHFREKLREAYSSIEALNKQWQTDYASFDEVYPLARGEVPEDLAGEVDQADEYLAREAEPQKRNYSRWVDQWMANIDAWYEYPRQARKGVHDSDPYGRVGTGCPMWPHAASGHDWYRNLRTDGFEMFAPYGIGRILPHEEARSFANPDTFLGMYYGGYLYNGFVRREQQTDLEWQKWRVWTALLRGFTSIWWYNGGAGSTESSYGGGLLTNSSFRVLCDQIARIRTGFYPLFDRNKAVRDYGPIAVHYSLPSRLAAWAGLGLGGGAWGHNYDVHLMHQVLSDYLGREYTFVADEQILGGELDKYSVLILPMSLTLDEEVVAALKRFVSNGGLLIADCRAGVADAHGRFREDGAIEDLLGFRYDRQLGRERVTARLSGAYQGVPIENPEQRFPVDPAVRLKGGEALFEVDGLPVFIVNKLGKGAAITLNIPFSYYSGGAVSDGGAYAQGDPDHTRLLGNLLHAVFAAHGIQRPVEVDVPEGGWFENPDVVWRFPTPYWLPGLEVPYHRDGAAQYVSLTKRRVGRRENGPYPVTVRVPRGGHIYNVLAGNYLGEGDHWTVQVQPADIQILAVLPYRVEDVKAVLDADASQRGGAIKGRVAVQAPGADGHFVRHVIHVQAQHPGGETPDYMRQVLETGSDGSADINLPLALNEPAGRWTVTVTDVASGLRRQVKVMVE